MSATPQSHHPWTHTSHVKQWPTPPSHPIYSLNDWGHSCIFILSYYHHWALLPNDLVSQLQNLLLYLDFTFSLSTLQTYVPTVNHICVPWCQQMAESVWQKGVLSYHLRTHNSLFVPHDLFRIQTVNLAIETVFAST